MNRLFQKGLSLVELMISLAMGSIITVGIVQLFGANSETYNVMMGQSRMQESARFALDFIARDIQKAGYRGCYSSDQLFYWTQQDPNTIPYEFDLRFGITGYDGIPGGALWLPSIAGIPTTNGITNTNVFINGTGIPTDDIVNGTDILTTRSAIQRDIDLRLSVTLSNPVDPIQVVAPAGGIGEIEFGTNDLALISDCEKATIFLVTSMTSNAPNVTIGHSTAPPQAWTNFRENLARVNFFDVDAVVNGIATHMYYVAPGAGENSSGDTPLSLWRKSGTTAPIELVEGIEDLQILYGETTSGIRTPNRYSTAQGVANWKDVVTVRVTVVANTVDDVGGTSTPTHTCDFQTCYDGEPTNGIDGLMRRSFTRTVMLRNRS